MNEHLNIFAALAAPFQSDEVRTRNQAGRELQYVTARTVMNRLDEVLGADGWWDEYTPMANAVICRLTIRLPDGRTVAKCDAGGFSTTADSSDYEKTGFSDAFKRAAVKFGVGRYLYGDGVPDSVREELVRERRERLDQRAAERPQAQDAPPPPSGPSPRERPEGRPPVPSPVPKTGKALFAWIKERDEANGSHLLSIITDWGKDQQYPARMVQWEGVQVDRAHTEALRLLSGSGAWEQPAQNGHSPRNHAQGARR